METTYEKTVCTRNKNQEGKRKHTMQNYSVNSASQKKLDMENKAEHNLQNRSQTHKPSNMNNEETYNITNHNKWAIIMRRDKLDYTAKDITTGKNEPELYKACNKHRILIIGDSHVRGLAEKISNCLNGSFDVCDITKPNADIESITSPIHLKTEQLTKGDLIIFLGGTNNISRNETKKGFLHKGLLMQS